MCIRTSQALCARTCQEHPGNSFNSFRDPISGIGHVLCVLGPLSRPFQLRRGWIILSLSNLSFSATNLMIDSLCTDYELFPLDLSLCLKKPSKNSATLLCLRGLMSTCFRSLLLAFSEKRMATAKIASQTQHQHRVAETHPKKSRFGARLE